MSNSVAQSVEEQLVQVPAGSVTLKGNLTLPEESRAIVLFAHGSGSSRHSPRNRYVARVLNEAKLATLLIDLLTLHEEVIDARTAQLRFDIDLLAVSERRQYLDPPAALLDRTQADEIQLARVADPCGTVQRVIRPLSPPQPDIALA